MKKILFLSLLIIIACSPSTKFTVTNIHDLASFEKNGFIYAIPHTKFKITLTAIRHFTIPGPYHNYAKALLGIESAPSMSFTAWEIQQINLEALDEPDPDYFYAVQAPNANVVSDKLFKMSSYGLVMDLEKINPYINYQPDYENAPEPIHFTDLSIKRDQIEGSAYQLSKEQEALVPIDMPDTIVQGSKTLEQKAVEAANFLIKIRKRKFKLLSGQYEVFPEGTALETSIRELNDLENKYLSLFIGKTYSDTISRDYFYVPTQSMEVENHTICRFSDETGFEDPESQSGNALVMELRGKAISSALNEKVLIDKNSGKQGVIFYRIPGKALVKIYNGSTTLYESEMKVFQYGSVVPYTINLK